MDRQILKTIKNRVNLRIQRNNQNDAIDHRQESDEDINGESTPALNIDRSKIGTKKLRKLEEKEQRRIQREMEAREREEEQQRKEEIDELRRKKEAEEGWENRKFLSGI